MIITFEHDGKITTKIIEKIQLDTNGIPEEEEILHEQLIDLYYFILSTEARKDQIELKKCTFTLTTFMRYKIFYFDVQVKGSLNDTAVLLHRTKKIMEEPCPVELSEDFIFYRFEGIITAEENGSSNTVAMNVYNAQLENDIPEPDIPSPAAGLSIGRILFIENLDDEKSVIKMVIKSARIINSEDMENSQSFH